MYSELATLSGILIGVTLTVVAAAAAFLWHLHQRSRWDAAILACMNQQIARQDRAREIAPSKDHYDPGICHVCGLAHHREHGDLNGESHGVIYCQGGFGYGSTKDLTTHEFCICEPCYDRLAFAVHPRVYNIMAAWYENENRDFVDENGNPVSEEE